MRICFYILHLMLLCFFFSCTNQNDQDIVSQTYVHKYGFNVSKKEWNEREQDGKVITKTRDGRVYVATYENGLLHGNATITYPFSSIIHKELVYDQNNLLKQITKDPFSLPLREEVYEFDDRKIITLWYDNGVPMSIEEYDQDKLMEGTYFNLNNELEATVENGVGIRIYRKRNGDLISKDIIQQGIVAKRSLYHPNGQLQSETNYQDYQLHGPQKKYTVSGKPLLEQNWNKGFLEGDKLVYRLGKVIQEMYYTSGKKQSVERHFDLEGAIIAEMHWKNGLKHGKMRLCTEDYSEVQWFFYNEPVSYTEFQDMDFREKMLAELSIENKQPKNK